jgi:hypothetical protein
MDGAANAATPSSSECIRANPDKRLVRAQTVVRQNLPLVFLHSRRNARSTLESRTIFPRGLRAKDKNSEKLSHAKTTSIS